MTNYIVKKSRGDADDVDINSDDVDIAAQPTYTVDDLFKRSYGPTIYPQDIYAKGPWVDVRAFGASGSAQQTTGSITAGEYELTLTNALDFADGMGVRVAGAGASGANLVATISSGGGTTSLTLGTAASTTVSSVTVEHDDASAIQAAYDYAYNSGMLSVYIPGGTYRIATQLKFYCSSDLAAPEVHGAGSFATKLVWTGSTACIVNGDADTYVNKPQVGCWGGFQIDASDATCSYVIDLYRGSTQWEFNKIRVKVPDGGTGWLLRGDLGGVGLSSQFNNVWYMCDVQVGTGTGLYAWRLGDTADVSNGKCNGNRFIGCRVGNNFKCAFLILGIGNDIDHCTVNECSLYSAVCKGINNRFSGGYFDGSVTPVLSFRDSDTQYRAAVQVVQVNGLDYFDYSSPHSSSTTRVHEYSHGSYAAAFTASTCTFVSGSATAATGATNVLGGRGSTFQFANPNSTYKHYMAAHSGLHVRSHMGSAMTDPADLASYANIQLKCEDNTALTGIIGAQNTAAGKWAGLIFSRQGYSEATDAVSDDGGTSVVINDGTTPEFRVVTTANGSTFTKLLEVGAGGANTGLRCCLRSTTGTMTGDETFTVDDGHVHVRNSGAGARTFNPSGTFNNGHLIILLNTGASNITFDSTALAAVVASGQRGIFVYRAAWYTIFVG